MHSFRRLTIAALVFVAAMVAASLPASAATERITGGAKAPDAQYQAHLRPIVALIGANARNQYDGQYCAGTLIDPQHVLTAGHCIVEDGAVRTRSAATAIKVLAGTPQLNEFGLTGGDLVPVAAIFVNPNFNIRTMRWDAAVLRLTRPVTTVPVAPRLTHDDVAALGMGSTRTMGIVAGWGDTNPYRDGCCYPSDLMSAEVPIHPNGTCEANLGNAPEVLFGTEFQFCAGRLSTGTRIGTDTCQGDSGGPLFVEVNGVAKHAGVTSYGVGCGEQFFGVYARTTALQPWLDSIPGMLDGDTRDASFGPGNLAAPTVKARPAGYKGVTLTITPATAGDAATGGYTIWARDGRPSVAKDIYLGRTTALTRTVAVPASNSTVPYTLLVRPVGPFGEGPSGVVKARPVLDLGRPTTPRGIRAVRSGSRIRITWGASIDRQSGVYGYYVQTYLGGRWRTPRLVRGVRAATIVSRGAGRVRVLAEDWADNRSAYGAAARF